MSLEIEEKLSPKITEQLQEPKSEQERLADLEERVKVLEKIIEHLVNQRVLSPESVEKIKEEG